MYRYSNEIHDFIIRLQENKHESIEDIEFLKTIMKEHLLLAALAARNINSNYEDCWFLVFTSNSKKKKGENLRILVTLQELEKKIAGCV